MKIAIFGGSFNPIHLGHIKMVQYLCENFNFDKIIVIPAGIPSHKESYSISGSDRYNMCSLAFASFPKVEISRIEIDSKKICYTIDTLMKLKNIYKNAVFYEIIGEDSANSFHSWKDFGKVLKESRIIVFKREGQENHIFSGIKSEFIFLKTPYFQYSSTEIRSYLKKKLRRGNLKKLNEMLPEKVLNYIFERDLYNFTEGD
ncbi:MAG: nicotinate (nicotinamide) nucleotide adenylyltransferase [Fusobacteriaceae bacterium]